MATPVATETEAQAAQQQMLAQFEANQEILDSTLWKWSVFGTTAGTSFPAFALNTSYTFQLLNSSGYLDALRIWLINVPVEVGTAGSIGLNQGSIWALLGSLQVRLGQYVYQIRAGFIPLVLSTFRKYGQPYNYPGLSTYPYSSGLFGSVNGSSVSTSIQTAAGTNTITGYLEIPMVWLESVKDPDGIMPTLSNAGVTVMFTTGQALAGADAATFPFYVATAGGTATLGTGGTVLVEGHMATFKTVYETEALPPFTAGVGYQLIENTVNLDTSTDFFATFQGQSTNVKLVKSIVVVNDIGAVAGQFGDPTQIQRLELWYDSQTRATENEQMNNPPNSFIMNFMVDQRKKFGDLPPNVFVFDWSAGTDPEYPNSYGYLDLTLFKNAGIMISRNGSWQTGAQLTFCNLYLNPTLYKASL